MNDMTPRKHTGSLIERASAAYDLTHPLRSPAIPFDDPSFAVPEPMPVTDAPVATQSSQKRATPVTPHAGVAIDRALLAERGFLVPDAPIGALAEEFRRIKRHLLTTAQAVDAKSPDKSGTILVCSAQPNDGKTYCAINLAISIAAEREIEVLLIDADFAKPDVMARLGLDDGPGLLDALADPAVDIESCVIATDIARLSVLPAGTRTTSDTELLTSRRTGELIARLLAADARRILIFDSPPALAASPASVLASHAGQVMLVVRADRTGEGDVREAITMLYGCDHIQLVLNAVSYAPGGRRFGSYYGQEDAK